MSGNRTAAPVRPRGAAAPHAPGPRFTAHRAGHAWLVTAGPVDPRARTFTAGLAADPEATVIVADLPDGADDTVLDRLARAVPAGTGALRLVFGRPPFRDAVAFGRQLAGRLGRTVITAEGPLVPLPGGGLYAVSDRGSGWLRCSPGAPDAPDSRIFPRPSWASDVPAHSWQLGRSVAEPVPSGVWLRPADGAPGLDVHRGRLFRGVALSAERLTVSVGAPGAPDVPVADVARFWQDLPLRLRPAVRFLCYGPARLSGGRHFGDVLAQVVGEPVRFLGGMPGIGEDGDEVLLTGPDGTPGRPLRAREFVHQPPDPETRGASAFPYAADHDWPLDDLPETGPGVHRLADEVVVEVVPSGLWIRPEQTPAHATQVRGADPDPAHERVLCDAGAEDLLPRLRGLAQELTRSFPSDLRRAVRLGVCRPTVPDAATAARPAPDAARTRPAPPVGAARPAPSAAVPSSLATLAAEVLHRHPELVGPRTAPEAVTALAAVLGRLAGADTPDDPALLRRGLLMLPVHRGPTGLRVTLDEPVLQWYAARSELTDPAACEASARGPADAPGTTDFLIWSVNGRRTDLLDPLAPDRVLFLPGTRFRILGPDPEAPGAVLMRELAPGEPPEDPVADRAAARDLLRARRDWNTTADA